MKIDPGLARNFFLSIREGSRDDLEYQKLLVNLLIDRIYLYDDRFDIFLNNSDRKGKVSDYEAADIERYFDNNPDSSSITLTSDTPSKIGRLYACRFLMTRRSEKLRRRFGFGCIIQPTPERQQSREEAQRPLTAAASSPGHQFNDIRTWFSTKAIATQ